MLSEAVLPPQFLGGDWERTPMTDSLMMISFHTTGNTLGGRGYQLTRILKRPYIIEWPQDSPGDGRRVVIGKWEEATIKEISFLNSVYRFLKCKLMKYKGQLKVWFLLVCLFSYDLWLCILIKVWGKKKVKIIRSWSDELFAAGAVKKILKWNIKSPVKSKILN